MITDAYFHFGQPRYGPVSNSLAVLAGHGIDRAVLVHGPFMPDLYAILATGLGSH